MRRCCPTIMNGSSAFCRATLALGATVRIAGESMTGAGLFPGDIAVVDRARTAVDGSIVLALLAGEFTVKRYRKRGARTWLQAENPAFENIEINEDYSGFEVWGVIAKSIRML